MSTLTKKRPRDGNLMTSKMFAEVYQAFAECSGEIQAAIKDMVEIVNDSEATDDEQYSALATIAEALFPSHHNGSLGIDLRDAEDGAPENVLSVLENMDNEEESFAQRIEAILNDREMTQTDLAAASGVGQPAISMMLSRQCRPQRRTVEKIANALAIAPEELWTDFNE